MCGWQGQLRPLPPGKPAASRPRPRWVSPYLSPPSLLSFPGALLTEEGSLGCPSFTAGDS